MKMNYTDNKLKQVLAKMLPDILIWDDETTQHNTDRPQEEGWGLCWDSGNPVLDTELLHLCWLIEQTIPANDCDIYTVYLGTFELLTDPPEKRFFNKSWQQRTIALAKVKGIEI